MFSFCGIENASVESKTPPNVTQEDHTEWAEWQEKDRIEKRLKIGLFEKLLFLHYKYKFKFEI